MRIALIHDWLLGLGGAERVLKVLHEMFPQAPIYTFFYNKKFTDKFLPQAQIKPSFLQKFYKTRIIDYKIFLPILPIAAESFDFSAYDLVISSSIAFSKGLVLKPKTKHICYCYSPTRFLWDWHNEHNKNQKTALAKIAQHFLRIWDRNSADRVDEFIAISKNVRQRIKKYYNRDSKVIYPPITLTGLTDTASSVRSFHQRFHSLAVVGEFEMKCENYTSSQPCNSPPQRLQKQYLSGPDILQTPNYFLIVSRLFPHKNIAIAIQAFNKLELPLLIIGDGPEYKKLKRLIENKKLIKMLGHIPDDRLGHYYANAKAFIMPQEEDFGLAPVEAMSFGKPVLALRRGGALEYVFEGINGEFFEDPHPAVLADGVRRLNENYRNYSPKLIKKTVERFSKEKFENEINNCIQSVLTPHHSESKI